jgi:hypothetical protein
LKIELHNGASLQTIARKALDHLLNIKNFGKKKASFKANASLLLFQTIVSNHTKRTKEGNEKLQVCLMRK